MLNVAALFLVKRPGGYAALGSESLTERPAGLNELLRLVSVERLTGDPVAANVAAARPADSGISTCE